MYHEKFTEDLTHFSETQMPTMTGPEENKNFAFILENAFILQVKVSYQGHLTTRLVFSKCFLNEKHAIQAMKIIWSKP